MALGDLDADGDLDLAVCSSYDAYVHTALNTGTGTFAVAGTALTGTSPYGLALADMDADGDLDLVAADNGNTRLAVLVNGGTGPLATAPAAAPAALLATPNPATGRVALALPPAATTAELLDGLGRVLRTVPTRAGAATLDVTGLAPGLYLVRAAGQVARLVVE